MRIVFIITPLQIAYTVIGFHLILMVHLWEIIRIWQECRRNKAMYEMPIFLSLAIIQQGGKITLVINIPDFYLSLLSVLSKAFYSALITNLISSFVAFYWLPDFFYKIIPLLLFCTSSKALSVPPEFRRISEMVFYTWHSHSVPSAVSISYGSATALRSICCTFVRSVSEPEKPINRFFARLSTIRNSSVNR